MLGTVATVIIALQAACSSHSDSDSRPGASVQDVRLTEAQRQNIQLYTVQPTTFHRTIQSSATVDFDNDHATSVIAPISGPVTRLLVAPGDQVKAGDPLAAVDSPDFAAAIGAYRKSIATARTARRLADLDKDLNEHQGVAQREAEQAQTDAVNAEADRDAALQALRALNLPAADITAIEAGRPVSRTQSLLRAPIAGTVAERLITQGQLLQAGTTSCFTIADLSHMWVMARVFGADIDSVHLGDSAQVDLGSGAGRVTGSVTNIAALVDPDTRSVQVRVLVDNAAGLLRKQMYVRVVLQAAQESNGILIPESSVLRDDENLPFVYLARDDNSFARQGVTLAASHGDQVEVPVGLAAGNRIVIAGGLFVQFIQSQ